MKIRQLRPVAVAIAAVVLSGPVPGVADDSSRVHRGGSFYLDRGSISSQSRGGRNNNNAAYTGIRLFITVFD